MGIFSKVRIEKLVKGVMIQLLHSFFVIKDSCIVEKNYNVESSTGNSQLIEDRSERDAKTQSAEGRKYK